ncbi:TldD/PmbA family protein [Thermospira aquatica]|uniref:TldD/PmbA family protein n=1 Tax=Thermospira aquatica TaxID=2828656 RepID=A0AAX3BDT2_9SPIR|nr:TldD/PmbA family protein [Thermospira aquatica]URA10415.1 TldD/PmbA family protein [Thermospira aquatica]
MDIDAIKQALEPADYYEIHLQTNFTTSIVYANQTIEHLQTSITRTGNIRVLFEGGWGFISFNGEDYKRYASEALAMARLVSHHQKEGSHVLTYPPIQDHISSPVAISPAEYSLEQKVHLVQSYHDLLTHPMISRQSVTYRDTTTKTTFVNSEGSHITMNRTFTGLAMSVTARDGTLLQRASDSVGQYGGMELVLGLEQNAETIKKRALDLLKAPPLEAGVYTVLLDPRLAGVFAHEAFGHLSEADFLAENPDMLEVMRENRRFGPEFLSIVDDGSIPGLAGYTPYDDEGISAHKTYLLKDGILTGRLHSRETAWRMNQKPTGNARAINPRYQPIVRMTNTYIEPKDTPLENMIAGIKDGIYACDYLGGMTNLEMFTFSAAYAYRIQNGRITNLVRDVVLTGNVFTTLENIQAIGNDLQHHGGLGGCGKGGQSGLPVSTGSPHILVSNVKIGGV